MTSNTVSNITKSVAKNILTALQNSQTNVNNEQKIYGKCDTETIQLLSKYYTDCLLKFSDNSKYPKFTDDNVLDICSTYTSMCKMNNIDMNSVLNVTGLTEATEEIKQKTKNAVSNTLSQYGGDGTDKYINSISDSMDIITDSIVSNLNTTNNIRQEINLNAVSGSFISIDTSLNVINNILQSNNTFQDNISKISTIITQTNDNQNNIWISVLIMLGIIVMSIIMIYIIMTLKRSSDVYDFFRRMMPVFIWVILSTVVTIIHILFKPGYVSFIDKDNIKQLNKNKLFFVLLGYYISFYIIISVVMYIINKNK